MTNSMIALVAMTIASLIAVSEGGAFLDARVHTKDAIVSKEDVESALAEFSDEVGLAHLLEVEDGMSTMFKALPKNQFGKLEPATVRYALHRYFVQQHGWFMMGLESGDVSNTSGQVQIMVDRAPALIQSTLEKRAQGQGMGLREVAIFAKVLTNLIHSEVTGLMHNIWAASSLPMYEPVDSKKADEAVKSYMMFYILEEQMMNAHHSQMSLVERHVREVYPAWDDTALWVDDFRNTVSFMQKSKSNPFKQQPNTFESVVAFTQEVSHHFSQYQRLECAALKNQLTDMEHQGSGRVLLSRFYSGALGGDWTFGESPEYLRHLGVLDETDPSKPTVVIPNYITSKTNCLVGSGFYSLCCSDECESLLAHIEAKVATPQADASQITAIVSSLPSDTVDAPRNLSSTLLDRLSDIANFHNGRVPLHGRLFAQWMHHVYPRECSQPQARSGAGNILSAKDWLAKHGPSSLEASTEELESFVKKIGEESASAVFVPWSAEEELVAEHYTIAASPKPWTLVSMRTCAAFLVFVSFAGALVRASSTGHDLKTESLMV